MDRSRRSGARGRPATAEREPVLPPSSSRLTLRARKNRRRPASLWSRVPPPGEIADACGRALRRALPAMVATCAVLGVGAALWLGYQFVTTSARYAITRVEVRGTHRLAEDEIRAMLPVALGDNVFTTSTDAVARALRRHRWIASATAQRVLPGTLVVEIREHEPTALAVLGDPYLVGADGHPFKRARIDAGDGAGLPIVTGLDRAAYRRDPEGAARTITAALDALARWRANPARPPIGELHVSTAGTLTLRTYDRGAAIDLGALDAPAALLDARLRTFDAAWAELDPSERGRARTFHTGGRPDHVIVAFAKD
jgi:cell division septal protein FtsQ